MLSIIICSVNPGYLSRVCKNITSTVGVEHELLIWDNREEKKGICEVYNSMAAKARYDFLCFVHEDVIFQTENWGGKIREIFLNSQETGVIGVAGSRYKSSYLSGWYSGVPELDCANIIHKYLSGATELIFLKPEGAGETEQVACLDGVFICCRKDIWEKTLFDQHRLTGFHFYDIDFSTRASAHCKVLVTFEILMEHITRGGDFGNNWVKVAFDYHDFHKGHLPVSVIELDQAKTDRAIVKTWLDVLKNYHISLPNKLKWVIGQRLILMPGLYYSILKFLIYKPLGLKYIHKNRKRK